MPDTRHAKSFCEICGSALPTVEKLGGIVVPAGSLDCDVDLKPTAHIYVGSRANWDKDLNLVVAFESLPTT